MLLAALLLLAGCTLHCPNGVTITDAPLHGCDFPQPTMLSGPLFAPPPQTVVVMPYYRGFTPNWHGPAMMPGQPSWSF